MNAAPHRSPRRAMIVERQSLMVPLLRDALECAGVGDVLVYRRASERTMRQARPDVVLLDLDGSRPRPLACIRSARRATAARIVVITRYDDPGWHAVARALGADVVLGARADRYDLLTALAI